MNLYSLTMEIISPVILLLVSTFILLLPTLHLILIFLIMDIVGIFYE
jgi:hypothetical protein